MTTPLQPDIALEPFPRLKVCNTCGSDDGTVQLLRFRWRDVDHRQDGGTGIALCAACRRRTRKVLEAESTLAAGAQRCGRCGHARAFHRVGTSDMLGREFCEDRHRADGEPACSCQGFE